MRNICFAAASALLLMTGVAMAQAADSGPVVQNSRALAVADQAGMGATSMRQQIQGQMTKAGYTDVNVAPVSFMVRAKDKQGNPVEMVIGPDSFTEVTEVAPKPATAPSTPAAPSTGAVTTPAKP